MKEKMLQTARDLLRESGCRDFQIRSLADRLGIAVGTVYKVYPSKDALLDDLKGEFLREVEESFTRLDHKKPGEVIVSLAEILEEVEQEWPGFLAHHGSFLSHRGSMKTLEEKVFASLPETSPLYRVMSRESLLRAILRLTLESVKHGESVQELADWVEYSLKKKG